MTTITPVTFLAQEIRGTRLRPQPWFYFRRPALQPIPIGAEEGSGTSRGNRDHVRSRGHTHKPKKWVSSGYTRFSSEKYDLRLGALTPSA